MSTTVTQTPFQAPPRVRVLKKIPRSSRNSAAGKLSSILDDVVSANDISSWTRLLYFASRCLKVPKHGGRRWSLTTQFNRQLNDECDEPLTRFKPSCGPKMMKDNTDLLGDRVSAKLEEGDFRGAIRLACSDDTFADPDATTIAALRSKHPAAHPETTLPSPPDHDDLEGVLSVNECDIRQAIRSFPKGSAGGPDLPSPPTSVRPYQLHSWSRWCVSPPQPYCIYKTCPVWKHSCHSSSPFVRCIIGSPEKKRWWIATNCSGMYLSSSSC